MLTRSLGACPCQTCRHLGCGCVLTRIRLGLLAVAAFLHSRRDSTSLLDAERATARRALLVGALLAQHYDFDTKHTAFPDESPVFAHVSKNTVSTVDLAMEAHAVLTERTPALVGPADPAPCCGHCGGQVGFAREAMFDVAVTYASMHGHEELTVTALEALGTCIVRTVHPWPHALY